MQDLTPFLTPFRQLGLQLLSLPRLGPHDLREVLLRLIVVEYPQGIKPEIVEIFLPKARCVQSNKNLTRFEVGAVEELRQFSRQQRDSFLVPHCYHDVEAGWHPALHLPPLVHDRIASSCLTVPTMDGRC